MKALIVSNSCWNLLNFRMPLIEVLQEHSFEIHTASPEDDRTGELKKKCNCSHHRILHLDPRGNNPLRDLLLLIELYQLYKKIQPDLIFHFTAKPNIYGGLAAQFSGIGYVSHITGLGKGFLKNGFIKKLLILLYGIGLRKTKSAFFHNEEDRALFISAGIVQKDRSHVVPGSGIDPDHFQPKQKKESETFIFVYTGRILPEKGVLELCEAATRLQARYPHLRLKLAGPLDEKYMDEKWLEAFWGYCRNETVAWLGPLDDLRDLLNEADVFVLASLREGKSKSLLEAMAMCLPVITTDAPGCRDIFGEGAQGILVPPGQVSALEHAMEQMLTTRAEDRKRMGAENRILVEDKYSISRVKQVYRDILFQPSQS